MCRYLDFKSVPPPICIALVFFGPVIDIVPNVVSLAPRNGFDFILIYVEDSFWKVGNFHLG